MSELGTDPAPTVYVCDFDDLDRSVLTQEAQAAGFEVRGDTTNAIELLQVIGFAPADLVLIAFELPGTSGLEATRLLREQPCSPEIILTTRDQALSTAATEAGVFASMAPDDLDALAEALRAVRQLLETGQRPRAASDRRTGTDRRGAQDWSKVISERRSGEERRNSPRREGDEH